MKKVYFLRYPHSLVTILVLVFAVLGGLLTWLPQELLPALTAGHGGEASPLMQALAQILELIRVGL
jgi:hypothetical protein